MPVKRLTNHSDNFRHCQTGTQLDLWSGVYNRATSPDRRLNPEHLDPSQYTNTEPRRHDHGIQYQLRSSNQIIEQINTDKYVMAWIENTEQNIRTKTWDIWKATITIFLQRILIFECDTCTIIVPLETQLDNNIMQKDSAHGTQFAASWRYNNGRHVLTTYLKDQKKNDIHLAMCCYDSQWHMRTILVLVQ